MAPPAGSTERETALSTAAQHWQDAATAMQQEIAVLRGRVDASQATTRQTAEKSLMATRLFGKPGTFDGGVGCGDSNFVFGSYEFACSPSLGRTRNATALTRIVNAGIRKAWKPGDSAGLSQELLNFSFKEETGGRLAQFDRDVDRYQKASQERLPDNISSGVALGMMLACFLASCASLSFVVWECRHEIGESTAINHRLNVWALLHMSSPFWVKATFQPWILCVPAGRVLQRSCAQPWFHCSRLLLVYQRLESTPPQKSCSRSVTLQASSHDSALASPARTALSRVLGGGQPRLCDLVFLSSRPVAGPPSLISGCPKAKLSVTSHLWKLGTPERCDGSHVYAWALLRRTRRLQLHQPKVGDLVLWSQAEDVGAGTVAARATTAEPCLNTQHWTPSSCGFRFQCRGYLHHLRQATRGRNIPRISSRPWTKSVLSTRSSRPMWCPSRCSARTARDCSMPDGSWLRKELPGPPSFDNWWASFGVYRTTLLLLEVTPGILDNFGEMVRGQSSLYDDAWFVVHSAGVRMRSDQSERLRRWAEGDHATVRAHRQLKDGTTQACLGAQRHPNCLGEGTRDPSRKQPRKSQDPSRSVNSRKGRRMR